MNVKGGLFGGDQWEERRGQERVIGNKYNQSTLYTCMSY
jgi:hypothetical protein